MHTKKFKQLLEELCRYGLSNHYVLYRTSEHVYFGNINYVKGHLSVKDTGLISDLNGKLFEPVWHEGLIGMICHSKKYEWESLTFYGLENCKINPDLSKTRGNALIAAQNQYGESIMDFKGSIYRGFSLLIDSSFLPVILCNPIYSRDNELGLIVSDLRTVPMEIKLLSKLNDVVFNSIKDYKTLQVNDVDISSNDFHKYFDSYLPK